MVQNIDDVLQRGEQISGNFGFDNSLAEPIVGESGVAKTRVRVTPRVRVRVTPRVRVRVRGRVEGKGKGKGKGGGGGKGKGENCCGNSNLDFHPKFLPRPKLSSLYFIFH